MITMIPNDPTFLERQECLLCSKKELISIWELRNLPFTDTLGGYTKDFPSLDQGLMICNVCGMVQLSRIVSPAFLYSTENYSYHRVNGPKIWQEGLFFRDLVKEIMPFTKAKHKTVLEIGGSSDVFISNLIDLFESALVIDPAPRISVESNMKVEFIQGFMEDEWIQIKEREINLVICRHVIEHISYPLDFLRTLFENVKEGTLLIFETPNFLSVLSQMRLDAVNHQHVSYFDPNTFRNLVESAGGEVVKEIMIQGGSNGGVMIYVFQKSKNRMRKSEQVHPAPNILAQKFNKVLAKFEISMAEIESKIDKLQGGFYGIGAGSLLPTFNYHLNGRISKSFGIIDDDESKHGKSYKNVDVVVIPPDSWKETDASTCLVTSLENRKVLFKRAQSIGFLDIICPRPLD